MSARKVSVAKNTEDADDIMIKRFTDFIIEPFTDPLLGFTLEPICATDPIDLLIQMVKVTVGLYLIAFIRVLRPVLSAAVLNEGGAKYQDIIIRNIDQETSLSEDKWFKLYSYASYRSKVSALLNGLRRKTADKVQQMIVMCHNTGGALPDWCTNVKTYHIWNNMEYGNVESVYRRITEWLFVQHNKSGLNVSRYLPSRDYMQCFRTLEKMFLHKNKTPLDLNVYCNMRMNAAYPGRSGEEQCKWMDSHVIIKDTWMLVRKPAGWKNTKSTHTFKGEIKVANDDPWYTAEKESKGLRPAGAKPNRFLRPLDKVKVCKLRLQCRLTFNKKRLQNIRKVQYVIK